MRKANFLLKLKICFIIQAFIIVNACFAYQEAKRDCLAPALELGKEGLNPIQFILGQSRTIEDLADRAYKEELIFTELLHAAEKNTSAYPFAKVASGISVYRHEKPYRIATNSIGVHRHAEVNLILSVLRDHLERQGRLQEFTEQLSRLEFLAYTTKLNTSKEALEILINITLNYGNPFEDAVVYSTLRPCAACLDFLAFMGIRQIYYSSEHQSTKFVLSSEQTIRRLDIKGIKVAQSYFRKKKMGLEPNRLFFALCNQTGYEKISETINRWFVEVIDIEAVQDLSMELLKKKEAEFLHMIDILLEGTNIESDLEEISKMLMRARESITPQDLQSYQDPFLFQGQILLMQSI